MPPQDIEALLHPSRMKTYRGEDRARLTCPAEPLDGTQKAAQAYVDRITRSAWWKRSMPPSHLGCEGSWRGHADDAVPRRIIVVEHRGGNGRASYGRHEHQGRWLPRIRLGRQHADEQPEGWSVAGWTQALSDPYVILHEVAHIMAAADGRETGHGRVFRWYLVGLVKRWLGPEHARALQAGYEAEGLKWRKPPGQPDYLTWQPSTSG